MGEAKRLETSEIRYYDENKKRIGSANIPYAEINVNAPPNISKAYPTIRRSWVIGRNYADISIAGVRDPDGDRVTIRMNEIANVRSGDSGKEKESIGDIPEAYGLDTAIVSVVADHTRGSDDRYLIKFTADDGKGGESRGHLFVSIPHIPGNYADKTVDGDAFAGINHSENNTTDAMNADKIVDGDALSDINHSENTATDAMNVYINSQFLSLKGTNFRKITKSEKKTETTSTPEPGTMLLLGIGLIGLAGIMRRFRGKNK